MFINILKKTPIIAGITGLIISGTVAISQLAHRLLPSTDTISPILEEFKGFASDSYFRRNHFEILTLKRMIDNPLAVMSAVKPEEYYSFSMFEDLTVGNISASFNRNGFGITFMDKLSGKRTDISYSNNDELFIVSISEIIYEQNGSIWKLSDPLKYIFPTYNDLLASGLVDYSDFLNRLSQSREYSSYNNMNVLGEMRSITTTDLLNLLGDQIDDSSKEVLSAERTLACDISTEYSESFGGEKVGLGDRVTMDLIVPKGEVVATAVTNSIVYDFKTGDRSFQLPPETTEDIMGLCLN